MGFQHYRELVPSLKQYQLVQCSLQRIEVNLVVAGKATPEQEVALTRVIQDALGYPFEMKFNYYAKELPKTRSGKFEEFVCKVT